VTRTGAGENEAPGEPLERPLQTLYSATERKVRGKACRVSAAAGSVAASLPGSWRGP